MAGDGRNLWNQLAGEQAWGATHKNRKSNGGLTPYALTFQKTKELLSDIFSFFNKRYLHQFQNIKGHRLYICLLWIVPSL